MTVKVKVAPASSRNAVVGNMADGTLKVNVAAPAERGKANKALREVLAAHFGVPVSSVTLLSGHGSPRKLVRVGTTPLR
jgi:hypothetical protein